MAELNDWDQLQLVLAIMRAGSLAGAARRLAIDHATAYRRLARLERDTATVLFERGRSGYIATDAGRRLAEAAEIAERAIDTATDALASPDDTPAGLLRVTTTHSLFEGLLAPLLVAFNAAYPQIELVMDLSNEIHDLARRGVDIAIRPANTPPEHLIGRPLGRIHQAVYTAVGVETDASRRWIGPGAQAGYDTLWRWHRQAGHEPDMRLCVNTGTGTRAAVRAGLGAAVLPCYLAEADTQLARREPPIDALTTELWLLLHPAVRETPTVRAFAHFIGPRLSTALTEAETGLSPG